MSEKTVKKRKHRVVRKRSVVDSAARNAASLTDGCNPEFVIGAEFDGVFEMPIIKRPKKMLIPDNLVPFSKMDKADPKSFAVCEYENDAEFKDILVHPDEYIEILKKLSHRTVRYIEICHLLYRLPIFTEVEQLDTVFRNMEYT